MPETTWLGPAPQTPARRVVSLVPSLTEAVFALGAGAVLLARTRFCIRPKNQVASIPTIRGTKNPDLAAIRSLAPDLVLANKEENQRVHVEELARDFPICLTDPSSPHDIPALWRVLGRALGAPQEAERRAQKITDALAKCPSFSANAPRFLYLIWKNPWMVAAHDTYISRLLECAGLKNALPPAATRYPVLSDTQLAQMPADRILFSSEPFAFQFPRDLALWPGATATRPDYYDIGGRRQALLVDGERLSWYPSQTYAGLAYARSIAEEQSPPTAGAR